MRNFLSTALSFSHVVFLIERNSSYLVLVGGHVMNLIPVLQIWLSLLLIVRALVVQVSRDRESDPTEFSLLPSHSSLIHRLNQTSLSTGSSADNLAVFCDADQYGRDLIYADCKDAITAIKRRRQPLRFGERSADKETWDVGLPFRQIGSEDPILENPFKETSLLSDFEAVQGLCTVQLELKPGRSSAIATAYDVSQAAVAVLGACVVGAGRNTGGLAIDIGEYIKECLNDKCNKKSRITHTGAPRRRQQPRRGFSPI